MVIFTLILNQSDSESENVLKHGTIGKHLVHSLYIRYRWYQDSNIHKTQEQIILCCCSFSLVDFFSFSYLFSLLPYTVPCRSKCFGIDRENVTWCVRIADSERNIETCVSLNETQEVFQSTCDAKLLDLERHLRFSTVRFNFKSHAYSSLCILYLQSEECSSWNWGVCLTLTNLDWFFKDAYITCISANDSCSDVTFTQLLTSSEWIQLCTCNILEWNDYMYRAAK